MRPEFKYGLIIGIGVSLWVLAEYSLGLHAMPAEISESSRYASSVIPLTALVLLLRQKQAAARDGRLSLGSGFASGLAASFIGGLIVYCFMLAYTRHLNPDWIDNTLALKVARLRAQDVAEITIRRHITFFRQTNSPLGLLATTLLGLTAIGGLFSLGITLFLRRQTRSRQIN